MDKVLDLHGLKHEQVPRIVDKFIGDHIQLGTTSISIITGHSLRMKEIVAHICKDYDIKFTEEWGNAGKMVLDLR
jgi:DNA-nicking Smr family endonuclease